MVKTVYDLEHDYWVSYLGKQGSLNSLRFEGYGALGGTGSTVDARERSYLGTYLGISGATLARTSLNDLRRQHRIQYLTNEGPKDTANDLDYRLWQIGFGGGGPPPTLVINDDGLGNLSSTDALIVDDLAGNLSTTSTDVTDDGNGNLSAA